MYVDRILFPALIGILIVIFAESAASATMPSSEPEKKPALGQRQPWEVETYIDVLKLVDCWPAPDLAAVLVETYFRATNTVRPLLPLHASLTSDGRATGIFPQVLPLLDEDNFKWSV